MTTLAPAQLTAFDDFAARTENGRWKYAGAKERHIADWMRTHFPHDPAQPHAAGITTYYQLLNQRLDDPHFTANHPALADRLRVQRED